MNSSTPNLYDSDRKASARTELKRLLEQAGRHRIWRLVKDEEGRVLAEGHADRRVANPDILSKVDFAGKSVLDIGCNVGFHSFLAIRNGATEVMGIDADDMSLKISRLIQELHGYDRMSFINHDFLHDELHRSFDLVLLVNFIGKQTARKRLTKVLDIVSRLARSSMVITAAHYYHLPTFYGPLADDVVRRHPAPYVRDDRFYVAELMRDHLRPEWDVALISPAYEDANVQRTFLFTRNQTFFKIKSD